MAKWSELIRNLKKIGYTEGERKNEKTIYNCPCPDKTHPVGVINHPNKDARPHDMEKQLGIHYSKYKQLFGKI